MKRKTLFFSVFLSGAAQAASAQVFSSEFVSSPVPEAWNLVPQDRCIATTWTEAGWYYQQLDFEDCPPPGGDRDAYRRSLVPFNGSISFFTEFRVATDGDRSGIPYGVPIVLVLGNSYGLAYHITIARDLIQFYRDPFLPILLVEIEPGSSHTYRLELYADYYLFYIDGYLIAEDIPEGSFPAQDAEIVWQGYSWDSSVENAWDYIRYGVPPADGSGDFDSDAATTLRDFYFVQECLTNQRPGINGGPDNDAGPGCRFADFDADSDVDLLDFAEFQNLFSAQ